MERFILYILKVNLLASVCILMVLFVSRFVKSRYSSHWRYMMWLLITVFLLFPIKVFSEAFTIEIPQQADTFFVDSQENGAITDLKTDFLSDPATDSMDEISIDEITIDKELTPVKNYKSSPFTLSGFLQGFFYLWLVGVAGLSVYKIIAYIVSMASLLRWSVPQKSENILDLYCSVCEERGIKKQPRLMLNTKLKSPILTGLENTYLCLPDVLYTEEELRLIFSHELSHYKHKDLWYKLLLVIVNTVYWFNPLLYLMAKEADKDLEYICDSSVLVNCTQSNHIIYSKLLLKTASTQNSTHYLSASLNDSATSLKERIIYMMRAKSLKRGIIPVVVLTSILVFSNTLVGCSIQKKPGDSESKVTSSSSVDKEDEPKVTPEVIKPTETPELITSPSTEPTPSQPIKPTEGADQEGEGNKNQADDAESSDHNPSDGNPVNAK
ncbi:MAG TPA: M48 family metalloprotease, partial [Candidatus Pelethocola excrementipullorum]|nr:M48 family metalloprotease [Candidatus Pelethocola excrementipullorum]